MDSPSKYFSYHYNFDILLMVHNCKKMAKCAYFVEDRVGVHNDN